MFEEVSAALGRNWHMSGVVILGEQRGQKNGFPTANLKPGHHIFPLQNLVQRWMYHAYFARVMVVIFAKKLDGLKFLDAGW